MTVGGLIERGEIHRALVETPDTLWRLLRDRTEPEVIVNALAA